MPKNADGEGLAPIMISVAGAAEVLGVSIWTMHKIIQRGDVQSGKEGGRRLVKVASLQAYADRLVEESA